jgi:hypothetical protein
MATVGDCSIALVRKDREENSMTSRAGNMTSDSGNMTSRAGNMTSRAGNMTSHIVSREHIPQH